MPQPRNASLIPRSDMLLGAHNAHALTRLIMVAHHRKCMKINENVPNRLEINQNTPESQESSFQLILRIFTLFLGSFGSIPKSFSI
jgi:hypothetical protein